MNATTWCQTQHEEQYNGLWEEKFSDRDRIEDKIILYFIFVILDLNIHEQIIKSALIVHSKIGYNIYTYSLFHIF